MQWTDDMIDVLKLMVAARNSAAQIGKYLGITRNAVIGAVHRNGLHFFNPPPRHNKAEQINLTKRLTILRTVAAKHRAISRSSPPTIEHGGLSIMELTRNTCRWPTCDSPWLFCGAAVEFGSPYCPRHTDRAYGRKG